MEFASGDKLKDLPTDSTVPTHDEVQIMQALFENNKKDVKNLFSGIKEVLFVIVLVFILFLPPVTKWLDKVLPVNKSPYILVLIKSLIIGIIFWLVNHFYLAKRN